MKMLQIQRCFWWFGGMVGCLSDGFFFPRIDCWQKPICRSRPNTKLTIQIQKYKYNFTKDTEREWQCRDKGKMEYFPQSWIGANRWIFTESGRWVAEYRTNGPRFLEYRSIQGWRLERKWLTETLWSVDHHSRDTVITSVWLSQPVILMIEASTMVMMLLEIGIILF